MAEEKMDIVVSLRDRFSAGIRGVNKSISTIGARAKRASGHLFNMKTLLLGFGSGMVIRSIVSTKNQFVLFQKTLETLEGSLAAATAKWDEMMQFAEETPFSIAQVMESYKMLRAFGLKPTIDMMTTLGDTASALGGGGVMGRLALVLGQIRAQGFMSAQDMNQLANAGVNAAQAMKDAFGVARSEVKGLADQGITADQIINVLLKSMKDKFGGQMAIMNKELAGQWEMLVSIWERFTVNIMDSGIYDYINKVLTNLNNKIIELREKGKLDEWAKETADKVIASFKNMIIGVADLYDVMAPIMGNFKKLFVSLWTWFTSLPTWVQTAGILGSILTGSFGGKVWMVALLYVFKETQKMFNDFKDGIKGPISETDKAINGLTRDIKRLEGELSQPVSVLNFFKGFEYAEKLPAKIEELKRKLKELQKQGAEAVVEPEQESMGVKARAFIDAMGKTEEKTKETFGTISEQVKKLIDDAEFDQLKSRIGAMAKVATKTVGVMTKGMKKTVDGFIKQATKAYQAAKDEAEDYANKIIEVENTIRTMRMGTADKIRNLERQLMSDDKAYADERRQAQEKMYAARRALAQGDLDHARALTQEAEALYAGLAREVGKDIGGKNVITQSLEISIGIAKQGIKEVGSLSVQIEQKQKAIYQNLEREAIKRMEIIKKKIDEIAAKRTAEIEIKLTELEKAQNAINLLIADETKHIKVKIVKEIVPTAGSGADGMRRGGIFSGYGGGDKINVKAEAGEGFVRKEAIRKYGRPFFNAYNSLSLPIAQATRSLKARIGGIIQSDLSLFQQRFQNGGVTAQAPNVRSLGTIDLRVGSRNFPVFGDANILEGLKLAIKKEGMLRGN